MTKPTSCVAREQWTVLESFGHIKVDLLHRRVFSGPREVKLTKLEFDLLKTLVQHSGKVLTPRFLLKTVWVLHSSDQNHYVRVFVSSLRKKLELNPARPGYPLTEQGVGYRLLPE